MVMVTEPERLELHQAMRGIIGPGAANTFMELAAPRDWDDVVRVHHLEAAINGSRTELREETAGLKAELKQDINNLRIELKQDMVELRAELKQDMVELRAEFKQDMIELRAEFKQDINDLRVELKQDISDVRVEIAQLRTEFTALLASELRNQTKWIIGVLTTLCVALIVSVL
jgi:outer membrane protein OmpA-like peptidoglycan-associated protein